MPYIKPARREQLDEMIMDGMGDIDSPGELNYVLTRVVIDYLNARDLSYGTINDVMGALEGAKLEFYRRVAVPYENVKITQNGDVYPAHLLQPIRR